MTENYDNAILELNEYLSKHSGKKFESTIADWLIHTLKDDLIFVPKTENPQWIFLFDGVITPIRVFEDLNIENKDEIELFLEEKELNEYLEETALHDESENEGHSSFNLKKVANKSHASKFEESTIDYVNSKDLFKFRRFLQLAVMVIILLGVTTVGFINTFSGVIPSAQASGELATLNTIACKPFEINNCIVKEIFDDSPVGTLVKQAPEPGWYLLKPQEVTLYYSKGPKDSIMPDIISMTEEDAINELSELGVNIGKITEENDPNTKEGRVISASVKTGDKIKNGDSINLVIASSMVELPDFKGMSKSAVEIEAKRLGLSLSFDEEASSLASGIVLKQSVEPGLISTNEKITITLSKPEKTDFVKIPNVIGKDEATAQALLIAAGFSNITMIEVENNVTSTAVTHVVPSVDQSVATNENIVLIISNPLSK